MGVATDATVGTVRAIALGDPAALGPWRTRWDDVARRSGALACQSSAWLTAWWSVLEPAAEVTLLVHYEPGEGLQAPSGLWALGAMRRRLHRRVPISLPYVGVAGAGLGAADHMGPLSTSAGVGASLLAAAMDVAGDRPLVLSNLASRHHPAAAGLTGAVLVERTPCPGVDLRSAATTAELWRPSRRGDIRRCERRMREAGFERRWVRLGDSNLHELDELQRLHRRLWTWRGQQGLLDDRRKRFLAAVAAGLDEPDGAWLQLIEGSGGPIAAMLALRFGSTMCSYATGWDPTHRRLGLGVLLEAGGIELALAQGLDRYDFLRGTEPHKFALGGVSDVDSTYCVPRGWAGPLLLRRDRMAARRSAAADMVAAGGPPR